MAKEGIELEVYHYSDYTKLKGIIPGRREPNILSEIKGVGGGSFTISRDDPKVVSDPELLKGRNICKVKVDGLTVGAFLFGDRESTIVSAAERSELAYRIAGPGLKQLFDDARVEAHGGIKATSSDTRIFNFASEQGSWYNPSDWITPYVFGNVTKGSVYPIPAKWPASAKDAQWIWGSPRLSTMPYGDCYFRYSVTLTEGKYAIYSAVDDAFVLYVDGAQIAKSSDKSTSWKETSRVEVNLTSGDHVIAYVARNLNADGYMGPAALAMALAKVASDGTEAIVGQSQASGWKSLPYPDKAPGWSPGEVLGDLLAEAGARGVQFPNIFTKTFTDTLDSNGVAWPEDSYIDWSFKVGDSMLSVVKKLEEAAVDIWVDPDTFELNMVPTRGVDRTHFQFSGETAIATPIEFKLGKHLRTASTQSKSKIKNNLLLKTTEGFVIAEDNDSVTKYGKIEGTLDTGVSAQFAELIATLTFNQRAQEEEGASYDLLTREYVPFRDFDIGDWVWAPDEDGQKARRRVMSISTEESDSGQTLYTIEFDTIFHDNEDRINSVLDKIGAGGVGSSSANTSGSTPGVGEVIIIPPITPGGDEVYQIPKAPTDLVGTSTGAWTPDGVSTISTVTLDWTAVTQDIDNFAMTPEYYKVEAQLYKAGNPVGGPVDYGQVTINQSVLQPFNPGEVWQFRVAAGDGVNWGAWSTPVSVTMAIPTTPMIAPATPTPISYNGTIIIPWDGTMAGSTPPPPQFRFVFAQMREYNAGNGSEDNWNDFPGGVLTKSGQIIIAYPGLVGNTMEVRLIAIDGVGIRSAPSAIETVTVVGVDLGDLDQQVRDAIEAAQDAADAAAGVADAAQIAAELAQLHATTAAQQLIANPSFKLPQPNVSGNFQWSKTSGTSGGRLSPDLGLLVGADIDGEDITWIAESMSWKTHLYDGSSNGYYLLMSGGVIEITVSSVSLGGVPLTLNVYDSGGHSEYFTIGGANQVFQYKNTQSYSVPVTLTIAGGPTTGELNNVAYVFSLSVRDITAVAKAQATADGKNTVWYGPEPPAGNHKINDIWFNTSAGYAMSFWDGSTWGDAPFGTTAIADAAITNAKIANLDAGKITTGYLSTNRLQAGTIGVSKLLVTNLDNIVEDGGFEYSNVSGVSWNLSNGATIDTVNPRSGTRALKVPTTTSHFIAATTTSAFQVEEGQQYRVEAWVRLDSGVMVPPGVAFRFTYGATEDSTITSAPDCALTPEDTTTTYTLVTGIWTVPAGARWARLSVISRETTAGKVYRVDDIGVYRMSTGELIVDGAVTAEKIASDSIVGRHIQAESIATPHLQAQAVTTEKIAAEAITAEQIAAGAIETNHLSAGSIKTSHISSEVGAELNIANNDNIRLIVGPGGLIPELQNGLDGTNAELTTMQQYYDFGPDGAIISKPGSVFATRIDNDSIDMLENGNVISYWNSGTLYVNQLVGERVTLGNHQIARLDATVDPTSTIIRFLGS